MRHQRGDGEHACRKQIQHGFEVASLGPAHETDRIVLPEFLVRRIVAAGPVGTRDLEGQLFRVELGSIELEARDTHENDASARATHARCVGHWLIALRCGGDQYAIDAAPAREARRALEWILAASEIDRARAELTGERRFCRIGIDPEHRATVRSQDLHRHQSDEPEAGDHETLTQTWRSETDALHRDGAEHGECGRIVRHRVWYVYTEIARHSDDLRVRTVRNHAIADGEFLSTLAHRGNNADIAIAERHRLGQLASHRLEGCENSLGLELAQHLPHFLWLLACFVQEPGSTELHDHALGAGRDKRAARDDLHAAALRRRRGHVLDARPASADFLE